MNARAPGPVVSLTRQLEKQGQVQSDTRLLAELWPYLVPYRRFLATALGSTVVVALLSLCRPLIMQRTIDDAIRTRDPDVVFWGGLAFLGVSLGEQLLGFLHVYTTQILGARSMSDLRRRVFAFVGKLPLRYFDNQPVGRIVTRVTSDVDSILELFNSGALSAVGDVVKLVGVVVLMFSLDVRLSLVALGLLPLVGILMLWVRKRAREAFRSIRGETARMNANMNEQVTGGALVRAYGREEAMFGHFDEINRSYRDANIRSIKYDAIQDAAIDAVSSIAIASLVVALGFYDASFGTVVALVAYLALFFEPISLLAQRYTLLQSAMSGAERVFHLLTEEERDAPRRAEAARAEERAGAPPKSFAAPASPGVGADGVGQAASASDAAGVPAAALAFELENVSFGYKEGHDVLHDVSLVGREGETIALVGPTGSGKTTIGSLLLRLYDLGPDGSARGAIRVLGRDVNDLEPGELRRSFSVVPQDVFLFPGTLAENIAVGETVDRARVEEVLRQMEVFEAFAARPGGIDTKVLAGGSNFSQGERQLIAFARALYRDAGILLLDEATASIDSATEARMQKALEVLLEGRTALVVAHRLSTVRRADRIVVLQGGRVIEQGTHEELLAHGGLYSALHRLQFAREDQRSRD